MQEPILSFGSSWDIQVERQTEQQEKPTPQTIRDNTITAVFGAILCLACDLIARMLFAPYELPVGIVLSFVGAPFILYLLLIRKKRSRHNAS